MGLFSKKEPCPICGEEVKGLFLVKIGGKQTLCKDCSRQVSMSEELLKNATPDFIREHLEYRRKNAEKYNALHWDVEYKEVTGLQVGVALDARCFYIVHDKLHDEDNPLVFSFDQLTGYEFYRLNKKVDDADTPGGTNLDTAMTFLADISRLAKKDSSDTDYFKLKLVTTDPYWPEIYVKIYFTTHQMKGICGFAPQMEAIGQLFKHIVRKEPVTLY